MLHCNILTIKSMSNVPRWYLLCCHHNKAIARVHPVHLMNADSAPRWPPTLETKPTDLDCESARKKWQLPSISTIAIFSERTTLRSLYAIGRPSVCCLSVVCLSVVCDVGAPYSGGWTFRQFFSPYDNPGTLLFWCQKSLVGEAPFLLKFAFKVTHPL